MKQLRGSSWDSFLPYEININWGLDHCPYFQSPAVKYRFPPYYNALYPRRTCYADRPGFTSQLKSQSEREELTQISNIQTPIKPQVSTFFKNGKIDINACFEEVNWRVLEIGCENFE